LPEAGSFDLVSAVASPHHMDARAGPARLRDLGTRSLDGVTAGPTALVLRGDPGIGKSQLWRTGCAEAQCRGFGTLVCRPPESEATMSFAALADLLPADLDEAQAAPPARSMMSSPARACGS
jgi:hypothetical protein